MTMYLPNSDIRPTGYEAAEFIEPPGPTPAPEPRPTQTDDQLQFLRDLVEENASVSGNVLPVGDNLWAIHGFIPVDGDVLMAEFDSYDQATRTLDQLSPRSLRGDES
jgi:hypothetical protein